MQGLVPLLMPVNPKHVFGDGRDLRTHPIDARPVGSGPFRFKEWVRGRHVILERNDDFFIEDRPLLERIVVRFIAEPTVRMLALETGEVDYYPLCRAALRRHAWARGQPRAAGEHEGLRGARAAQLPRVQPARAALRRFAGAPGGGACDRPGLHGPRKSPPSCHQRAVTLSPMPCPGSAPAPDPDPELALSRRAASKLSSSAARRLTPQFVLNPLSVCLRSNHETHLQKRKTPLSCWNNGVFLVAGVGFEPTTFRL